MSISCDLLRRTAGSSPASSSAKKLQQSSTGSLLAGSRVGVDNGSEANIMSIDCSKLVVSELPSLRNKQAPDAAEQPFFSGTLELGAGVEVGCYSLYRPLSESESNFCL